MKFEVVAKYGHTSQTFYILLIHNIYILLCYILLSMVPVLPDCLGIRHPAGFTGLVGSREVISGLNLSLLVGSGQEAVFHLDH